MSRVLKIFVLVMLVAFVIPHVLGLSSVSLENKLKAADYVTQSYTPFPSFPEVPAPDVDTSNPIDAVISFLALPIDYSDYVVAISQWTMDFAKWLFTDILIGLNLARVFCLNYIPKGAIQ